VKGFKPWIFKIQNSRNAEKPSRKQIEAKITRGKLQSSESALPFFEQGDMDSENEIGNPDQRLEPFFRL